MGNKRKKKSAVPTYIFVIIWLLGAIVFRWGFWMCLVVSLAAKWLAGAIFKDKKEEDQPQKYNTKAEEPVKPRREEDSAQKPAEPERAKSAGSPELDNLIVEGRASVIKLQQINDDIPDFKFSAKLKQIEILTASIIDQVEKKPNKIREVRQFMNYYLPKTISLLEQYVQLQNVGMKGENITSGMTQIEAMLDKIIVAYQKQLDSLFEREVIDITADIQVMEQMMASQGLTDTKDF